MFGILVCNSRSASGAGAIGLCAGICRPGCALRRADNHTASADAESEGLACGHERTFPCRRRDASRRRIRVPQWQEVPCTTAPAIPYLPARGPRPDSVGNGHDVSAQVTGHITEAIGSFDSVTGVTSETGTNPYTQATNVPNVYSLQLNSNFFTTSTCNGATNPSNCRGWQQFVYASDNSHPEAFMQYWLITYGSNCPSGWMSFSGDCYRNSSAVAVPQQAITNLVNLSLTGQANAGGIDTFILAVGSTLYSVQGQDNVVNLAQGWQQAEFNVVGDGSGSAANFNSGSTLVVRTSVNYGSPNAPSCSGSGFTGETNNLNFGTAPTAQQESLPAVVFTESSAGGAASPCASATDVPQGTPTVTSISPASGPPAGGTSVTITGTGFTGVTAVKFGSTAASSFTFNSGTSITATSPAGTGTVDVTVTTPKGTSATRCGRSVYLRFYTGRHFDLAGQRTHGRRHQRYNHRDRFYRRHRGQIRQYRGEFVHLQQRHVDLCDFAGRHRHCGRESDDAKRH